MKAHAFVLTLGVLLLALALPMGMLMNAQIQKQGTNGQGGGEGGGSERGGGVTMQARDYRLSGPYTHNNLTIFLIHGKSVVPVKNFLTLQEALEQKKVIVYETKSVNELAIENISEEDVYVQSGDIVKGGQQDRVLTTDLIVPPKSGKMPIDAFCVESGRWSKRANERVEVFSSSAEVVSTKDLKLAAKRSKSQGAVWENVRVAQDKLSENVGTRVNSTVSESSLQLAVENPKVRESADGYVKALTGITAGKNDVIGYVFAINGKVNSADVYGSSALFTKLWPKLLKANAVEAISELQKDKFEPVKPESVSMFLAEAEAAKGSEKAVTSRVKLMTREDDSNIMFETRDEKEKGAWVHRNYIKKN